jgi:ferredoxin-type protein NapH
MQNKPNMVSRKRTGRINLRAIRVGVLTAVTLGVLIGEIEKLGVGNLSSLTVAGFSLLSPLEFLEVTFASQTFLPLNAWIPAVVTLAAAVVLGRFFCGWICPFALLRIVFRIKEQRSEKVSRGINAVTLGDAKDPNPSTFASSTSPTNQTPTAETLSRYAVLVGVLGVSALFRVPIFLQFWPAGLFFGFLFAVARLFSTNQPSLELVVFPILLAIELSITSWCRSICPLGTLLSLASGLNRLFRPVVNQGTCLVSKGLNCEVCHNICPEKIDLRKRPSTTMLMSCSKCLDCSVSCPVAAISFPLQSKNSLTGE